MLDLRETVTAWERGWAASRGIPEARAVDGGLRVECRQPTRDIEYIALDADDDPKSVVRLAELLQQEKESAWLTVATREPDRVAELLESVGLDFVSRDEALMAADLRTQPSRAVVEPYRLTTEISEQVAYVRVWASDDTEAARGYAGIVGSHTVADKILTAPEHRRRALGATVMSAIADVAIAAGAPNGLLIGSVEGQALYQSLGWTTVADVLIARPR